MAGSKIDYTLPPGAFFFPTGAAPGLSLLAAPDWLWREAAPARISGFGVSRYEAVNARIAERVSHTLGRRSFAAPIAFNTVPALLEDAAFAKWAVSVRGRWLLNGAAGTRLRNRYAWRHDARDAEEVGRWLGALCSDSGPVALPEVTAMPPASVPVTIELRNGFNFFHFLTETLPLLASLAEVARGREIFVYHAGTALAGFMPAFVSALFPELAGRLRFVPAPAHHDRAICAYNFEHFYFQSPPRVMPALGPRGLAPPLWVDRAATARVQTTLRMNSYDEGLARLRARGRALVAEAALQGAFAHLPRRFWIARDPAAARARPMRNEAALIEALRPLGFEVVYFERLSPIEQVAIMARAEVMISSHGAGFANMLWAGPEATVIEIGTLQTASIRWGMFMPLAHVAGCRYVSFFADHDTDTPEVEPVFSRDGIVPVSLGEAAVGQIAAYVGALLGQEAAAPRGAAAGAWGRGVLARMLADSGAPEACLRLLGAEEPERIARNPALLRAMARASDDIGDPEGAYWALSRLWGLDPRAPGRIERLVWLARRLGHEDLARGNLAEFRDRFPGDCAAFLARAPGFARLLEAAQDRPDG